MAKAACLNVPAFGHINPSLALTAELARRGEQVTYFAPERFRHRIEGAGVRFEDYGGHLVDDIRDAPTNPYGLARYLLQAAPAIVEHVMPKLQRERPDYLIHDMLCVWGPVIATLLGVPAIATVPTFSFTLRSALASPRTYFELLKLMVEGLPDYASAAGASYRLWRRYGVVLPPGPRALLNYERLNVVFTSPNFQPHAQGVASGFHFIGACTGVRAGDDDAILERLTGQPLVYVSLGTVFNARPSFYREALSALGDLDVQAIIAVGDAIDPQELAPIAGNCLVVSHAPQLALLPRTAVFVTHGGMNSVNEALYFGVPMVVVPQMIEQRYVARRVATLGAGLAFPAGQAKAKALRQAVSQVLADESYRLRARVLGDALRAGGGAARGATAILEYVDSFGGTSAPRGADRQQVVG